MVIRNFLTAIFLSGTILSWMACRAPEKADLRAFLPAKTLLYMETGDLTAIGKVFTENKAWKAISDKDARYLSSLENKQAVLALVGTHAEPGGDTMQVQPDLVLLVDTQLPDDQAEAIDGKILSELGQRFFREPGEISKSTDGNVRRLVFTSAGGRKLFGAVIGAVALAGNTETGVTACISVKQGAAASFSGNRDLQLAREKYGAEGQIAFGLVPQQGVSELSGYLGGLAAQKSSEFTLTREMISGALPGVVQRSISSVVWTAKPAGDGIEETYAFNAAGDFGRNLSQTIKPAAPDAAGADISKYLPADAYTASEYDLAEPQTAWRGLILSIAAGLDKKELDLFREFSGQLLKPYGIDDPESFMAGVDSRIITVRFDEAGDESAVIAQVKDAAKIKQAISETFDIKQTPQTLNGTAQITSKDSSLTAVFAGDVFILGTANAVTKCLQANNTSSGIQMPPDLLSAGGPDAIVSTRQRDGSAELILSSLAAQNGGNGQPPADVNSYSFSQTTIDQEGLKRRAHSAFGLLGEIVRQTLN
jgi:hypothetical protein